MKPCFFLAAILATAACSAQAQDRIVAPSPSSRAAVDLFESAGASAPVRQAPVAELGLPLAIQESKASYHRVAIGGQDYWIKGVHVRILRGAEAGCATRNMDSQPTIATPGAGQNVCK
jgi:hypothetical protein